MELIKEILSNASILRDSLNLYTLKVDIGDPFRLADFAGKNKM